MSRRKNSHSRTILPDPRFNSLVVSKFISRMMLDGKKSVSARIFYGALGIIKEKGTGEPLEVFLKALDNVKPMVEVKSRRVGGSTYQVPVEIRESRRDALAMRWIIQASRSRAGRSMAQNLSTELIDAFNSTGVSFKKKEDTHKMAEANKAFTHYRW
ncbi:MAG: 30S ribosomal protein S7 [Spirochaetales bacterium]|jgi:small subunit ribosomal protein S7|nr:30S ribosomal protein S7 [Spirochaetales bacterium]